MMTVIAGILTTAMTLQYAWGEIPCPLCLLQRVAMFGVCFGIILQFRHGFSYRNTGLSMVFSLFLLIVSVRQTLLDIYPRPGHEYIGSAVFGMHMPVWSVLIAVALLTAFAIQLIVWGNQVQWCEKPISRLPLLRVLATILSLYVIAIGVVNFVSVGVQCGVGECHTFGYALLK
ncbi:disulfide bond formation protein B [Falsochrobactrum sp. TDYN1]|uniref:Disulfide bond formation protein B n=2 Tax=Falsochrobactrum tianjinense TaxID=2706015 RepID=A0A949PPZ4_9HYPH|nr:disulfide bond formation protein B [Falsochrobactrum sp. TDYN1]